MSFCVFVNRTVHDPADVFIITCHQRKTMYPFERKPEKNTFEGDGLNC